MNQRTWRTLLVVVALGLTSGMSRTALAADGDDEDEVATYAVQRRLFRLGLELNAGVGILPLNAFDKGFIANGSVTWHFSSILGWEIAQGSYVLAQMDTGLKRQLLDNFGVQPTELTTPLFLGSSNLVFTPYYGKLAGMNHTVDHIEIFIPVGPAIGRYDNPGQWQAGLDLGLGLRWFLGTHVSLRIDARDYLLTRSISNFSLTNELMFALGLSVAFGGAER